MRAAASSIPSGIPSSRAHAAATSSVFVSVRAKPESASTARAANSPTAGPFADRVYLSYEDRRNGRTNVYVLRLTPDLTPIGRPIAVVRASRSADRFLPAIDVDQTTGDVWDCFYATDGSRDLKRVRFSCAISRNGGGSWSPPARAASRFSRVTRKSGDVTFGYGDYEGVAAGGGLAHPMWTDARSNAGGEIWTATLTAP